MSPEPVSGGGHPGHIAPIDAAENTAQVSPRGGCFVAVVGPSGAGKDTLMRLAATKLQDDPTIRFARRTVTRTADAAIEDHDELSPEDFDAAERAGGFCLSWRAHDLRYGLSADLNDALDAGRTIVANVSRRVLGAAAERFSRLVVVEVTAPRRLLVERLAARGREAAADIEARLSRQVELATPAGAEGIYRIVNDGHPEAAATALAAFIKRAIRTP